MVTQLRVLMVSAGEVRRNLGPQPLIHSLCIAATRICRNKGHGRRVRAVTGFITRPVGHTGHRYHV